MVESDVVVACCRASGGAHPLELYPDPDSELLVAALGEIGVTARMASWDDDTVTWDQTGLVVIRSTWDSVDRPGEYLRWARAVDRVSTLVNPAEVLAWNLDKSYLGDLARMGVPVMPTQFVRPGSSWTVPEDEFVVKPAISAGGRETARYGPAHRSAARAHVSRLLAEGHTVMVQPYLRAVEDPGEISLVFIAGGFSHAVRKGPVLEAGAGVADRPWERMVFLGLTGPSPTELAVAERVQSALDRRFGTLAYSRVDLITGLSGEPLVMEVELIDPYLSLSLESAAVARLAQVLAGRREQSCWPGN